MKDYLKENMVNKVSEFYDKWDKIFSEENEEEFNKYFINFENIKNDKEKMLEFAVMSYMCNFMKEIR